MSAHADSTSHYVKIWVWLTVLFIISVCGPMLGIQAVTIITAFGIALVKAYLVASNFMHLNIEKKYVIYMLLGMVLMVILFFAGTAPDVMTPGGQNWERIPLPTTESAPAH
ncbi:MAG: cytochrome C oxidase subunit IV family protein [Bdellovibrionaceae bacterium]|nr:cytochrome C oxidase subunit IV family protein [Bdellovibrionales bacterium]MCB9082694.1 cytochrome C oxidase subunit IV family protein [Pseudobdellovibrionaceae bacterium]